MTDRDKNKIVGLCGYPGCGKDALAAVLVEKHGYKRVALADSIKEMLIAIDPVYGQIGRGSGPLEFLERCKREGRWDTREKLQRLGKYMRDTEGEDYWLDRAMFNASDDEGLYPYPLVFTDVRYSNEAVAIRGWGGTIVGITRPDHGPVNDHESEKGTTLLLSQADIVLDNNDTIESLVARFITCV